MRIQHARIAALSMPLLLAGAACGLGVVGEERSPDTTPTIDGGPSATPPVITTDAGDPPPPTTCIQADGGTACAAWAACEDGACVDVAQALVAFRQELACGGSLLSNYCDTGNGPPAKEVVLTGSAGAVYALSVRVRGVIEQKEYTSSTVFPATGTNAAFLTQGGTPKDDNWTRVDLRVTAPDSTWHLNSGASGHDYVNAIDYRATISAMAGASVDLSFVSNDTKQAKNRDQNGRAVTVSGIAQFDGQLVQVDVEAVTRR